MKVPGKCRGTLLELSRNWQGTGGDLMWYDIQYIMPQTDLAEDACKYKISLAREMTLYKSQSNKNEFGFSSV